MEKTTNKIQRQIIGLTGTNAAGKGSAAQLIQGLGFSYGSLSDVLRQVAKTQGIDCSRENLIILGNKLRMQEGSDALAKRLIESLLDEQFVVDSIRNPAEVEYLKNAGKFVLLGIDAPVEIRFARAKQRGRPENANTIDEFRQIENLEKSSDPYSQQLHQCLKMADRIFINDQSLSELEVQIKKFLLSKGFQIAA